MSIEHRMKVNVAVVLAGAIALAGLSACGGTGGASATDATTTEAPPLAAVADVVDDGTQDRVAQLSLAEGNVSILPVEADEWEQASVNEPVLEGYQVYADDDSRGELLIGDGKYARFADGATVTVSRLDPSYAQFELGAGTCELALDQWSDGDYYEISAPGGALVPQRAGSYRVDVLPDGGTRVIVTRGSAEITTPSGTFIANEGDVIDLGDQPANVNVVSGGATGYRDAFYDWSGQRDVYYRDLYAHDSPEPVRVFQGRNDIYGVLGLAAFGAWQSLDNDRYCWVPNDARRSGWAPYQDGYWDYGPTVGWTWVSHENWGWAPYHYGRWDYTDRFGWAWSPYYDEQIVGVSSWRNPYRWHPAEVYFCQPPQSRSFAWVPLAPGEPYYPYTTAFVTGPNVRVVDFRPRFLRERRAIFVVTPDELERRERPHLADRVVIQNIERAGPDKIAVARLPRPQRIVAANEVARVRPGKADLDRAVVVTQRSLDRPVKPATQKALAQAQRQIAKANDRKLDVNRQAVTAANAPKPIDRKGRRANEVVTAGQTPAASGPAPAATPREQRRAERQQQKQSAPGTIAAPPRQHAAAPADRQQRRIDRQRQAPKAVSQPAPRTAKPARVQSQPHAVQAAPRQSVSQPRVVRTKPNGGANAGAVKAQGGQAKGGQGKGGQGKRNRP